MPSCATILAGLAASLYDSGIVNSNTPLVVSPTASAARPSIVLATSSIRNNGTTAAGSPMSVSAPWIPMESSPSSGVNHTAGVAAYIQASALAAMSSFWTPVSVDECRVIAITIPTAVIAPVQHGSHDFVGNIVLGQAPAQGNLLVMTFHEENTQGAVTPSGWTQIAQVTYPANGPGQTVIYAKCAGLAESATMPDPGGNGARFAQVSEWSGVAGGFGFPDGLGGFF